jgi:hypothetical protein
MDFPRLARSEGGFEGMGMGGGGSAVYHMQLIAVTRCRTSPSHPAHTFPPPNTQTSEQTADLTPELTSMVVNNRDLPFAGTGGQVRFGGLERLQSSKERMPTAGTSAAHQS